MGKDKKNKSAEERVSAQAQVVNEDLSVEEEIRKGNLIDEDIAALGDLKDEEEEKERKIREYRRCKNMARYINLKKKLLFNKNRREEHAMKASLDASKELLDKLTSSKLTPNEYEAEWKKICKEEREAINKSNEKFDKQVRELREGFPGYYSYEWDSRW
jgi:hypothetical protein